jgi:hypothetical protein
VALIGGVSLWSWDLRRYKEGRGRGPSVFVVLILKTWRGISDESDSGGESDFRCGKIDLNVGRSDIWN